MTTQATRKPRAKAADPKVIEAEAIDGHVKPVEAQAPAVSREQAQVMTILERAIMDPEMPVERLERLWIMQKDIMDRQAEREFAVDMAACQAQMPRIAKGAENKQTKSMYATLDAINAAITPVYTEFGFSLTFNTGKANFEGCIGILCDVIHKGGHVRKYSYDSPLDDKGIQGTVNKTKPHAHASAVKYGQRYLTTLIFNLTVGGDDDGNAAGKLPEQTVKTITADQAKKLKALLDENGMTEDALLKKGGIDRVEDLPADQLNTCIAWIKKGGD